MLPFGPVLPFATAALAGSTTPTMQLITDDGLCIGTTLDEVQRGADGRYQARKK